MHLSAEHKICKIIFTPTRRFSPPSVFTPSLLVISVSSMFKNDNKTKLLLKMLGTPNESSCRDNWHQQKKNIKPNWPAQDYFKILNTQMHPISSMTGFFNLKFCNLIHNSEYISLCIFDFCTAVVLKETVVQSKLLHCFCISCGMQAHTHALTHSSCIY